jgi:serine/threonine protein kinase
VNKPDWVGQTLGGRYQIQELLGQGGMSSVFKALDPNLQRIVAIKLIHPHLSSDPRFTARFEDEARAVAKLRQSNIVQVYDFNHEGELYYMVQEFVPGQTLQSVLAKSNERGDRLPLGVAIKYTVDVCHAIEYAHRLGMIHRDIKPANIMINEDDQAILMDFGIVKLLQGESHTTTGTIVGTLSYMSPDLMRGEPPEARSDIYSLGVVLFEMLSGRVPFQADSAVTLMMMHQNNPVPDLRALRQDIPEDLIAIVQKALAKTRPERYSSAGEMAAELSAANHRLTQEVSKPTVQVESPLPTPASETHSKGDPSPTFALPPQKEAASAATSPVASPVAAAQGAQVSPSTAPTSQKSRTPLYIGIAALALIAILIAGGLGLSGGFSARPASLALPAQDTVPTQAVASALPVEATARAAAPSASATPAPRPSETAAPSEAAAPAETALPETAQPAAGTAQPGASAPASAPSSAIPTDIPYAQISKIEVDSRDHYVVSFEMLNPDKLSPGDRTAFFFNDAPRTEGGFPQQGFYTVYTAESPFTILKTAARSKEASQMCAWIGKSDDSLIADSGNCFPLPDVASVTAGSSTPCLAGPGADYPVVAQLAAGETVLAYGVSPDQSWWYAQNPSNLKKSCWVAKETTSLNGDSSSLKQVEPPPTPTAGY